MARVIGAEASEMWRSVTIFKSKKNGELLYYYSGLYARESTARGVVSRNKNHPDFYDGWVERCELIWHKVRD